jgi:hypothetical protein
VRALDWIDYAAHIPPRTLGLMMIFVKVQERLGCRWGAGWLRFYGGRRGALGWGSCELSPQKDFFKIFSACCYREVVIVSSRLGDSCRFKARVESSLVAKTGMRQ